MNAVELLPIVIACLNNSPFAWGYRIQKNLLAIPDGEWKEIFNSDDAIYGGQNVGNRSGPISSSGAALTATLPANGLVVLVKQ